MNSIKIKTVIEAHKDFDRYIKQYYKNTQLVWAQGTYKSRECKVTSLHWTVKNGRLDISLRVKTRRKTGKGYLKDDNYFFRCYYSPYWFASKDMYELLY